MSALSHCGILSAETLALCLLCAVVYLVFHHYKDGGSSLEEVQLVQTNAR